MTYIASYNYEAPCTHLFVDGLYYLLFATPSILVLMCFIGLVSCYKGKNNWICFSLVTISTLYFVGAAIAHHALALRYQIIIIPLLLLFIISSLKEHLSGMKVNKSMLVSFIVFSLIIIELSPFVPFYYSFNNILLPKEKILMGGWGQGGHEAAEFLNLKYGNQTKNMVVYESYDGFWGFFDGKTIGHKEDPFGNSVDYFVFFIECGKYSNLKGDTSTYSSNSSLYDYYRYEKQPEFEIKLNEVPFIKVVKAD